MYHQIHTHLCIKHGVQTSSSNILEPVLKQSQQWRPLGNVNVTLHRTLANILNWYCRSYLETPLHPSTLKFCLYIWTRSVSFCGQFLQKGKCCANHTMWRNWPQVVIFWGKYKSEFAIFGLKSPARHQSTARIFFFLFYSPLWPVAKLFGSIFLYMIAVPLTAQNWKKKTLIWRCCCICVYAIISEQFRLSWFYIWESTV
jgi:hypothetical protein